MRLLFQTLCVAVVSLSAVVQLGRATAADLKPIALEYRRELAERILPYWYDTAVDWQGGGYRLADDAVSGLRAPDEKQIVSQARMVWTFSLGHRHGFSTPARDYLKAASHGVAFLRQRLKDSEQGGYFWSVYPDGRVRDDRKRLYGEAFVIYALVEYYRASADRTALDEAMQLYRDIQTHAYDAKNGGWLEHFERDWKPMPLKDPNAIVEVAGYKSANTHLHLMEALTDGLRNRPKDAAYEEALVKLFGFVKRHLADRRDGIWLDTVTADGRPKSTGKAHSWKANYHDVRGLLKFVEAFENAPGSAKK